MNKEEELRINATISEFMLTIQTLAARAADLSANLAVARAEIAALKTTPEQKASQQEPTLKAVE